MENEKMDVFARALLYLAKAVYANHGIDAEIMVVPTDKHGEQERG